jgi:hypothetical protein
MTAVLAGGLAVGAAPARAHPPLVATDDAAVLARGDCELEAGHEALRASGLRGRVQTLGVGCGVGAGTQAGLAWSRARGAIDAGDSLDLAGKTALAQAGQTALALGWGLGWQRPQAGALRQESAALTLLATRPLGRALTLQLNAGAAHARGERVRATWAAAAEVATGAGFDLTVETYGAHGSAPGQALGLRWPLSERLQAHAALARQGGAEAQRVLAVGVVLGF